MKHSNTSEPPKQFYQRNDSIYPMGSISRMNERGRMWEASQDLITQIKNATGRLQLISTGMMMQNLTPTCVGVKVANGQLREGSDVFVMFFRVYSCGDTQELEYFERNSSLSLTTSRSSLKRIQ